MIPASDAQEIRQLAKEELARRDFWRYCNLIAPDFYLPNREYLKEICQAMQELETDDTSVLIVDAPPRFGKSRTLCLYVEWLLGRNPSYRVMTGSYNEILSTTFAKSVRDTIMERGGEYERVFPMTRIKQGDAAMNLWSLEGSDVKSYLATSPSGTATGFGADFIIVDDIIKSAYEANSPATLDKHWDWFANTMYSRLEGRRKILIFMTQWSESDLPHRAKAHFESIGVKVKQMLYGAVKPDGSMLDEGILSRKEYENKRNTLDPMIFETNYNNRVIECADALYDPESFKTYKHGELRMPWEKKADGDDRVGLTEIKSRVDSADEGSDWLAKVVYARVGPVCYVLDVLMSQKPMEETEGLCAEMDARNRVNLSTTESNNGGKGFARFVEEKTKAMGNSLTRYIWKPTTKNKETRILTAASGIASSFVFPEDWKTRWRDFYLAMKTYKRTGKNEHDDAPDCLTACWEDEFARIARISF